MHDTDVQTQDLPLLFTPITMGSVTARNRIVASPMCQYRSDGGGPNDWQLAHLGRLAIGGCGIVFGEETAVEARGRKTYSCAGLYTDEHVAGYRRINQFLKENGAVPAIQLGHSGRNRYCFCPGCSLPARQPRACISQAVSADAGNH